MVEASDAIGSRWLFGGAAATSSLALGGAWVTLRHLRRNRRRWLNTTTANIARSESTSDDQHPRQNLATLADLLDAELATGSTVRGVLLGDDTELRVRGDAPPPPPGWDADATTWRRSDPDAATPRLLSPALVAIGNSPDTGDVLLDLATAGTVSVTGDRVAVDQLMCSMLWELASCPLGVAVELYVVGLACVAEQHAARRAQLSSLDEALAAAVPAHVEGDPVRVFLVDPFGDGDPSALAELVSACTAGSGRAVVMPGRANSRTRKSTYQAHNAASGRTSCSNRHSRPSTSTPN